MRAEPAPRLGMILLVWTVLIVLIGFSCSPVLYALAVVWSGRSW